MLEERKIAALMKDIGVHLKAVDKVDTKKWPYTVKWDKLPEFYSGYSDAVNMAERIVPHCEIGVFPANIFKNRAPNQTQEEYEYVKDNYKNFTLPVSMDYLSALSRAWHDNNWNATYPKEDSQYVKTGNTLKEYLEQDIDFVGSLENYVKYVVPSFKMKYANGVVCTKPKSIKTITVDGVEVVDGFIEPQPYQYTDKQVVGRGRGEYYIVMLPEKTNVDYGGKAQNIGYQFDVYDDTFIWSVRQTGKFIEYTWEITQYYEHGLGYAPVIELMGVPYENGDIRLWKSPMMYVVDILDNVATNANYLQVIIANTAYPYTIEVGNPCQFIEQYNEVHVRCIDGFVNYEGTVKACPACKGIGLVSRKSPTGKLLLNPENREGTGDKLNYKPLEFVAPDVNIFKFLDEKVDKDTWRAERILHLKTSNTEYKPKSDTATGDILDEKAHSAFLKPISDQSFTIYEFLIDTIGRMRYGESYKKVHIEYPTSFDFMTEADYMRAIADALSAKLPPFVVEQIVLRYLRSIYFNDQESMDIFKLIQNSDRLLLSTNDDIRIMASQKAVAPWEIILHYSAVQLVKELISLDEKFLEQDLQDQRTQLIDSAKSRVPVNTDLETLVTSITNVAG